MADRFKSPDEARLRQVVEDIVEEVRKTKQWGKASDAIPELVDVDVHQFGLAVVTCDGVEVAGGDAETPFLIQSISKVFALTLAMEAYGDGVWKRVGREPSGDPFNSIRDLEQHEGIPRNPFINAGALVVVDMLVDHERQQGRTGPNPEFVRDEISKLTECNDIRVDEEAVNSSGSSGYTNRALANLAKSFGNLKQDVREVHEAYIRQCSILLSCRQLAKAGLYLTWDRSGIADVTVEEARRARRVLSLMLTCGQYDGAGEFAFRVGLPAKSGVGGGILAVVPNVASVAVWSPGLDEQGNSLLGTLALERLAERMDWSVFGSIEPHGTAMPENGHS